VTVHSPADEQAEKRNVMESSTGPHLRCNLFGIGIDTLTMSQAVQRCQDAVETGGYLSVGVVNAAKIVIMQRDPYLRTAVTDCEMVLVDGQAVVWASRMLRSPLPERVAGIDLFIALLSEAASSGYRVYFLGARPEVLAKMLDEVSRRFPRLKIAGARDGYFDAADEPEIAAEIQRSGAELLFVGMSSPRKELFLNKWGVATGARVLHGVGGSFDVLAGVTKRAPLWWQRSGLEWLYRTIQEPARLGPRYLKTNAAFMALVARAALQRRGRSQLPLTDDQTHRGSPSLPSVKAAAPAVTAARGEDR
jgi:N-acetylglucosaminyldiphosphoundecaprenol N-acetyl-beta-D-mannosaminyltransferase